MPKIVSKPDLALQDIVPGRLYQVRIEDVVYKAVVRETLPYERFLVGILDPLGDNEQATLKFGDKRVVPAEAFLEPYVLPPADIDEGGLVDGTEELYHERGISNAATTGLRTVDFIVNGDIGIYTYTLVLTDPQLLGKKSIIVDVEVALEGLVLAQQGKSAEGKTDIGGGANYWFDTDDPKFERYRRFNREIEEAKRPRRYNDIISLESE